MKWDFSKVQIGQMVNIQAYKHNGKLYRQWSNAKIIFHNKRHIVLSLKGTRVVETSKNYKGWKYKEDAIWFFPKDSLYNTIVLIKRKLGYSYYTNLASRPIFEDNTIKFIDYDLDIKSYPNRDLQIVDKEEFKENSKLYNYPEQLKKDIYNELTEVITLYNKDEYFFNEGIIAYYLELMLKDKLIDLKTYNIYTKKYKNSYSEETEMFNKLNKYLKY
ncbi:DUF402 domain-containing protein [Mycoplasma sp. CSL7503-lung]|uniref:DUF402 domain-containing protein n=1 Tax=Mycoplasma sp. CSL7503-lung TaxID=536372 RepID=UPI0021D29D94|nr:DUF402 domain-containing protein [Mycoplasma sp. CSL7503-lung]MCU4706376.1 DUF402 domain-containing protein [Mycoplasma sp. CSL7503-lung]